MDTQAVSAHIQHEELRKFPQQFKSLRKHFRPIFGYFKLPVNPDGITSWIIWFIKTDFEF